MRNLIEYMPPFLKNIREFNKIFETEDIELQRLDANMNLILTEVIVKTARSFGLDRYEKIYSIKNMSKNIEARRAEILTKINSRIPFTYKWLYSQLEENFGTDGFEINIDYANYQIEIIVKGICSEIADILIQSFYDKLPANLEQIFKLVIHSDYYMGAVVIQKEYNTLTIDTSIIEENINIDNGDNVGMTVVQLENAELTIDNSVIEELTNISQDEEIGSIIVQKEIINLKEEE